MAGQNEHGGSSWAKWAGITTAAAAVLSAITAFLVWWHPRGQAAISSSPSQSATRLSSQGVVSPVFVGTWTGTVRQPSGVVPEWTITLDISAESYNGTFHS